MQNSAKNIVLRLTVQKRFFDLIVSGKKTVEGRLAKPKYCKIQLGDVLELGDGERVLLRHVAKVEKHADFRTMLTKIGHRKLIPDVSTVDEALDVYYSFSEYKEKEKEQGVVAIWMTDENSNLPPHP